MITSYRKSEAPAGKPGQARADTAGGQLTASTAILSQSKRVVKPEDTGTGEVVVYLRPGQPVDVQIHAIYEEDTKRLRSLAEAARARLALLEAP